MSPGLTASTASALSSSTAIQPGPLSAQDASTMADRSIRSAAATCASRSSVSGPSRSTGGAAKASPSAPRRTRTRPAWHSCTITPPSRGVPPAPSHAWQVPRVGCPAKGSSVAGVKIRTR